MAVQGLIRTYVKTLDPVMIPLLYTKGTACGFVWDLNGTRYGAFPKCPRCQVASQLGYSGSAALSRSHMDAAHFALEVEIHERRAA